MKNYYFWDIGTATAAAIISFTVVRPGTIKRVTWNAAMVENGASTGVAWTLSLSPVSVSGVQANEATISQVVLHVDWRSAASMTMSSVNFDDYPDIRVSAGQILYFHREAITAAASSTSMKCLVGIA